MKTCNFCLQEKDVSFFTKDQTTPDGLYRTCKECKRTKARAKYASSEEMRRKYSVRGKTVRDRNNLITNGFKQMCGCGVCGENSHVGVLDFHHLDPNEKEFGIGGMISMSRDRIIAEIQKCIVLCANCHRKIHLNIGNIDVFDIHTRQQVVLERIISENS